MTTYDKTVSEALAVDADLASIIEERTKNRRQIHFLDRILAKAEKLNFHNPEAVPPEWMVRPVMELAAVESVETPPGEITGAALVECIFAVQDVFMERQRKLREELTGESYSDTKRGEDKPSWLP